MKKQVLVMLAALLALTGFLTADAFAETDAAELSAAGNVYAILYEDGTLVFQNGDASDGRPVKARYGVNLEGAYNYISHQPWYEERKSIYAVNFADKVSPTSTAYWFDGCSELKRVDNIANLDTANVTNMSSMFYSCNSLTALDVSHFNTVNVTTMGSMFCGCRGLTELDVSRFDTANVTAMFGMFEGCIHLTELDTSHFDTANVTAMGGMFQDCLGLTALDLSNFNTAKVKDMNRMFDGCSGLTALNVSSFRTANVTDMRRMFYQCSRLKTLDVSSFDTAKVKDMQYMFYGCSNLKTIYATNKFTTASVTEYTKGGMFLSCKVLVGGNGTKCEGPYPSGDYARIDTAYTPGYFTAAYEITADEPDTEAGTLSVTLSNLHAATVAASYFDANGKFVSVEFQDVHADAGTVELALSADAKTARVMLLDGVLCPLCAAYGAYVGGAA